IRRDDISAESLAGRKLVFVTGTMLMDSFDGEPTGALLADARAAGATTLLDTVYAETASPEEWRRRVWPALAVLDYFVPSFAEARALTGLEDPGAIAQALQAAGARNIVVKLGERGAVCRNADGRETLVPAYPVANVVDTTGAGDCWSAGFLVGLR